MPSEAQARQHLERARGIKRPIDFLSAVAHQCRVRGRIDAALVVWRRVLDLNPELLEPHEHLGKLNLIAKKPADALPHLQFWALRDESSSSAFALLGTALVMLERWSEAEAMLGRSLGLDPAQPEILTASATALWRIGRIPEAINRLERLLEFTPGKASTINDIGVMLLQIGRYHEAAKAFTDAVRISPDSAMIQHNLAIALRQSGRPKEALPHALRAIELANPTSAMLGNLAMVYNDSEQYAAALGALSGVDAKADRNTLTPHIIALRGLKRHDEAASECRSALESDPSQAEIWPLLGNILTEQGNAQEAEAAFDLALQLVPTSGATHRSKAELRRYQAGDPHLARMEALFNIETLSAEDRVHLDFALAKAYDDLSEFERAFEHLRSGNRAKRASTTYDEGGVERLVQLVTSLLPERIEPVGGCTSNLPVFVVGMPRSGTTLVEQILARHPSVVALGETKAFHRALDEKIFYAPEGVTEVADDRYRALAESYLESIRAESGDAERAIDKLPSNFFFAGFAAKAIPNARIIHVQRDPVDTCISLYSKLFTHTQNFSYDLAELGRYYARYRRVTDHWRTVISPTQFLEVRYEDLVENPEQHVRRMLAFIGLPWDEACLQPNRKPGVVLTASMVQVRRSIYKTSVGRREGYLPFLAELLEALSTDLRT